MPPGLPQTGIMGFTELGDPFVCSFYYSFWYSPHFLVAEGWTCAEPIRYRGSTL